MNSAELNNVKNNRFFVAYGHDGEFIGAYSGIGPLCSDLGLYRDTVYRYVQSNSEYIPGFASIHFDHRTSDPTLTGIDNLAVIVRVFNVEVYTDFDGKVRPDELKKNASQSHEGLSFMERDEELYFFEIDPTEETLTSAIILGPPMPKYIDSIEIERRAAIKDLSSNLYSLVFRRRHILTVSNNGKLSTEVVTRTNTHTGVVDYYRYRHEAYSANRIKPSVLDHRIKSKKPVGGYEWGVVKIPIGNRAMVNDYFDAMMLMTDGLKESLE